MSNKIPIYEITWGGYRKYWYCDEQEAIKFAAYWKAKPPEYSGSL